MEKKPENEPKKEPLTLEDLDQAAGGRGTTTPKPTAKTDADFKNKKEIAKGIKLPRPR